MYDNFLIFGMKVQKLICCTERDATNTQSPQIGIRVQLQLRSIISTKQDGKRGDVEQLWLWGHQCFSCLLQVLINYDLLY